MRDNSHEVVRWVPGWEGLYAATSCGKVISYHGAEPKELSGFASQRGHMRVQLCRGGKVNQKFVHRLVLRAFKGEPESDQVCRHLNGDPSDNRLENLEWGTQKENWKDKRKHGRATVGVRHGSSRLKASDVKDIRRKAGSEDITHKELADSYSVSPRTIYDIVTRRTWRHL